MMAVMPLFYLALKEAYGSTWAYLNSESILFTCWYLPELALVMSLWYANYCQIWPDMKLREFHGYDYDPYKISDEEKLERAQCAACNSEDLIINDSEEQTSSTRKLESPLSAQS